MGRPAGDVDTGKPLYAYGVDSLLAVELRNWFGKEIGAEVAIFDIMGGQGDLIPRFRSTSKDALLPWTKSFSLHCELVADPQGLLPLFLASRYSFLTVIEKMIEPGNRYDFNSTNQYRETPLSLAVNIGNEAVVRRLIERNGININLKDNIGRTPLL